MGFVIFTFQMSSRRVCLRRLISRGRPIFTERSQVSNQPYPPQLLGSRPPAGRGENFIGKKRLPTAESDVGNTTAVEVYPSSRPR